jgi:hypothetical protein
MAEELFDTLATFCVLQVIVILLTIELYGTEFVAYKLARLAGTPTLDGGFHFFGPPP